MKKFIIIVFLFFMVGCSNYKFTRYDFVDKADFNGYLVQNDKSEYSDYDYIKDVYYAYNRELAYFIQYIELIDNDYAKRFYEQNKLDFVKSKTSDSYTKERNLSNYNLYHLETSSSYKLIIRSENSIIYVDAPIGYINEIEEFLSDMELDY